MIPYPPVASANKQSKMVITILASGPNLISPHIAHDFGCHMVAPLRRDTITPCISCGAPPNEMTTYVRERAE